jgi:hypothetical protein
LFVDRCQLLNAQPQSLRRITRVGRLISDQCGILPSSRFTLINHYIYRYFGECVCIA